MGDRKVRILIADDQPQVRSAVRLILGQKSRLIVVGEAENLAKTRELVSGEQPDILLLDWELPGWKNATDLAILRKSRPGLTVVALSGRPESRRMALAAGVNAFVSKGEPPERLLAAVERCCIDENQDVSPHHH